MFNFGISQFQAKVRAKYKGTIKISAKNFYPTYSPSTNSDE